MWRLLRLDFKKSLDYAAKAPMFSYTAFTPLICNLHKINERIAWKFLSLMSYVLPTKQPTQCDLSSVISQHSLIVLTTSHTCLHLPHQIYHYCHDAFLFSSICHVNQLSNPSSALANNHFNVISWKKLHFVRISTFSPSITPSIALSSYASNPLVPQIFPIMDCWWLGDH